MSQKSRKSTTRKKYKPRRHNPKQKHDKNRSNKHDKNRSNKRDKNRSNKRSHKNTNEIKYSYSQNRHTGTNTKGKNQTYSDDILYPEDLNWDKIPINNVKRISNSQRPYIPLGFDAEKVNNNPYIVSIENFVTDEEVDELIEIAEYNGFERSNLVVDGELVYNDYRTSETSYLLQDGLPEKYSPAIEKLIQRICYLMRCERSQIEGLMMVRYPAGYEAYFWDHVDYFEPHEINVLDDAENRAATFFVYLNTRPEYAKGGETEFPELGLKALPIKNSATFWWNKDRKGDMIPATKHRGNPVEGWTKYGLNIWIREGSFY